MIPEGWTIINLEKVAKIQTGLAKGKKGLKNIVTLPYLRVANVQDGYLDLKEIKEIEVDESQVSRYLLQYEDILLTEGGDFDKLGRGSIWHCQIKPCLHQNHIFVVRTDTDKLNCYFLCQQISSPYGKAYFLSCAKQTTNLASINSTQLKEFPVLLPSIYEQRKIVNILNTWDKAIALLEQLITAKCKLKQGLMQQLLTRKKRFKEFEGSEWAEKELGEVTIITRLAGAEYSSVWKEDENGEIIALRGFNIGKNRIIEKNFARISNELSLKLNRSRLYIGDVVYPCVGTIGNAAVIEENDKYHIQQNIAKLTPIQTIISSYYLAYYLMSSVGLNEVLKFNASSSQPNVLVGSLRKYRIPLPPLGEQQKIASILSAADAEISNLEKKLAAYKQQKRGLMQQLLTGKKRVKIDEPQMQKL